MEAGMTDAAESAAKGKGERPAFLDRLHEAYNLRRKNIVLLTGDVQGLFWNGARQEFAGLEPVLVAELTEKFNVLRFDLAGGVRFYDAGAEAQVVEVAEADDGVYRPDGELNNVRECIDMSRSSPLACMTLLKAVAERFATARVLGKKVKPLCVIAQYAGAMFPSGEFDRLSELDRQRLVFFLSWVADPKFADGPDLLILVNPVRAEVNGKITSLPNVGHMEIGLPSGKERGLFVDAFCATHPGVTFEQSKERFVKDTAGLTIANLKDLLEMEARTNDPVERTDVVNEINLILQARLGDIIRVKYPEHGPADIIGYAENGRIFSTIFERCEDPETAVPAILISGPNGAGKTFQLEAHAAQSGRVVIELAGIRGSYFGETDKFFELLRWHLDTFGKILILVDEAHTAFGSVHSPDSHETEKRLAGNIIKVMGDPHYLGKVLWGLMTSRPDELDPDIKSRSPIQVPIFDLEGDERRTFVAEMFRRKQIEVPDADLSEILRQTDYYSARDYRNFLTEVVGERRKAPAVNALQVLAGWQASRSIKRQREFQELIAALHCSYPRLLPQRLRAMPDEQILRRVEELKILLRA
jgi:hypothetical protein